MGLYRGKGRRHQFWVYNRQEERTCNSIIIFFISQHSELYQLNYQPSFSTCRIAITVYSLGSLSMGLIQIIEPHGVGKERRILCMIGDPLPHFGEKSIQVSSFDTGRSGGAFSPLPLPLFGDKCCPAWLRSLDFRVIIIGKVHLLGVAYMAQSSLRMWADILMSQGGTSLGDGIIANFNFSNIWPRMMEELTFQPCCEAWSSRASQAAQSQCPCPYLQLHQY